MTLTATHIPVLETERLRLRPPTPDDVPAAIEFYMSERSKHAGGFRARINATAMLGHWAVRGYGLWAVTGKNDDSILGMVGPYYPDGWPETDIGWVLFDGAEGKGIATEAAHAALNDARTRLGWTDIVSFIAPENTRSIHMAERLGAKLDTDATVSKPDDPCLVYRHPRRVA